MVNEPIQRLVHRTFMASVDPTADDNIIECQATAYAKFHLDVPDNIVASGAAYGVPPELPVGSTIDGSLIDYFGGAPPVPVPAAVKITAWSTENLFDSRGGVTELMAYQATGQCQAVKLAPPSFHVPVSYAEWITVGHRRVREVRYVYY